MADDPKPSAAELAARQREAEDREVAGTAPGYPAAVRVTQRIAHRADGAALSEALEPGQVVFAPLRDRAHWIRGGRAERATATDVRIAEPRQVWLTPRRPTDQYEQEG